MMSFPCCHKASVVVVTKCFFQCVSWAKAMDEGTLPEDLAIFLQKAQGKSEVWWWNAMATTCSSTIKDLQVEASLTPITGTVALHGIQCKIFLSPSFTPQKSESQSCRSVKTGEPSHGNCHTSRDFFCDDVRY